MSTENANTNEEIGSSPVKSNDLMDRVTLSTAYTPYVSRKSYDESDEAGLVGSLSTMKIDNPDHNDADYLNETHEDAPLVIKLKRSYDHQTIEGTPCNPDSKRFDHGITPARENFIAKSVPLNLNSIELQSKRTEGEKVLVICSASDEHDTGEHQENARRTALLSGEHGCLRRPGVNDNMVWVPADNLPLPAIADLLRVHDYEYLAHLEKKCQGSYSKDYPYFYATNGMLDTDTPLVAQSFTAAKRFCSAAMLAVDQLFTAHALKQRGDQKPGVEQCKRAFVIGRPPGHHAGPNGCVPSETFWRRPDMTSSGFCLLNTVAVAAAYARYKYGSLSLNSYDFTKLNATPKRPPRIAIVDFDVHHGNGTEEIVRNLEPRTTYLPLPSSWAPVSKFSYKPWLNESDPKDTLFASIQLFAGEKFYPGSGKEDPADLDKNIVNITLTPVGPGPWDQGARARLTQAKRDQYQKIASEEFRTKTQQILLPKLQAFQPDLLFFSAGFDIHIDDFYHFLTEEDIYWITNQLCHIVDSNPESIGVISVLEGGYSLESVQTKPVATGRGKAAKSSAPDMHTMFAQQPGDGGLVKGVLAHTAALASKSHW